MIFAYNEDGTLQVVADVAEARQHFESYDVESGAVRFFNAEGKPLEPQFPQRSERRFLGVRISSDPGPYDFVSAAGGETLAQSLGPTVVLMPNSWFATVDAVHAHLATTPGS
jgi:hypothetical protein